jgi:SprT protein
MIKELETYIPSNLVLYVRSLVENEAIDFKVVNQRSTKHGDFRYNNDRYTITINKTSNKFRFLLTLIHELAHFFVFKNNRLAKPHGLLWKQKFQSLLNPILNKEYFPINLLSELIDHMKNPKSSFCYDINLSKKLDLYDNVNDNVYLDQLNDGEIFYFRNLGKFKKINKIRKRYLCLRMYNDKKYLFLASTKVKL